MARVGRFRPPFEGDWLITNDNLSLSGDRQLMGGDTVDPACDGGFVDNSFASAENNGPCTEASYNCITTKGTCKDSSCTADIVQGSVTGDKKTCLPLASYFDVGSGTAIRVYHHCDRPILVSIVFVTGHASL